MRQRTDDLLSQCGLQTAMHPGLGLQPTMPHLPYCTMQAGLPLTGTLVPVRQMHYPMGLACAERPAKKQKAVPTQSTAQLHLDMVDDYIKIQVDQQRGSVAASMANPRKRKLNAKNAKALHRSLLSTPDLPHTPGHSLQPAPRTHVSPISSTPRPTPDMPPSPDATRTHTIQSSDICGRVTRPSTKQPHFLTPLDVAPAVHPDAPSTGPCAQPPRHPVHSHSRAANCHTSAPPIRHHWAGCPPPFCV
jgi:hypothetical protein